MTPLQSLNGNGRLLLGIQGAILIIALTGSIVMDCLGTPGAERLMDLVKVMVGALFGTGAAVTITQRQNNRNPPAP